MSLGYELAESLSRYGDEWYLPYFDGYTGPYYSAGRLQGSTTKNPVAPKGKLGHLSREHDFRYAKAHSLDDLDRADQIYYDKSRKMSLIPRAIGAMPYYGNAPGRALARWRGHTYKGAEADEGSKEFKMSQAIPFPSTNRDPQPGGVPLDNFYDPRLRGSERKIREKKELPPEQAYATVVAEPVKKTTSRPIEVHNGQCVSQGSCSSTYGLNSNVPDRMVYTGDYYGGGSLVKKHLARTESEYRSRIKDLFKPSERMRMRFNSKKKFKRNKVYVH